MQSSRPLPARVSRPVLAALALVAAVGCGSDEEKYAQATFADDYSDAVCTLYAQCQVLTVSAGYEDEATCQDDVAAKVEGCSGYKDTVALKCVDAVNTLQCQELFDGDWPEDCASACSDGAAEGGFTVE